MDQNQDFSALRSLLASSRLDLPKDTQVEQFLLEFHNRQRAQLFVRQSILSRSVAWMKERIAGLELVPSLSYGTAVAAIAITAFVGLSQQVEVVTSTDGQSKLTFRMPTHETSFAMVPGSLIQAANIVPMKSNESPNFASSRSDSSATRYVLANTAQGIHDATVAF